MICKLTDLSEHCDFNILYNYFEKNGFIQMSFFSAGVGGCYDEVCITGFIVIGVSFPLCRSQDSRPVV